VLTTPSAAAMVARAGTQIDLDGDACTNQAESYFSRQRRAVDGQHHHVSPQYLYQYGSARTEHVSFPRVLNSSIMMM